MDEEKVVAISFKYKDIYSMSDLYGMARLWLDEEGFTNTELSVPENFMETFYLERTDQLSGKEYWIWWRPHKIINNYIKLKLDIDYHVLGMTDIEIMHKGKKIKIQQGETEMFFTGKILTDWNNKWQNSPIMKYLEPFFRKQIYKKELEKIEIEFRKTIYRFHQAMKDYLEMKTYFQKELPITPARGKA